MDPVDFIERLQRRRMLLVIDNVFRFLDFADLKNAKLLSKEWHKAVSEFEDRNNYLAKLLKKDPVLAKLSFWHEEGIALFSVKPKTERNFWNAASYFKTKLETHWEKGIFSSNIIPCAPHIPPNPFPFEFSMSSNWIVVSNQKIRLGCFQLWDRRLVRFCTDMLIEPKEFEEQRVQQAFAINAKHDLLISANSGGLLLLYDLRSVLSDKPDGLKWKEFEVEELQDKQIVCVHSQDDFMVVAYTSEKRNWLRFDVFRLCFDKQGKIWRITSLLEPALELFVPDRNALRIFVDNQYVVVRMFKKHYIAKYGLVQICGNEGDLPPSKAFSVDDMEQDYYQSGWLLVASPLGVIRLFDVNTGVSKVSFPTWTLFNDSSTILRINEKYIVLCCDEKPDPWCTIRIWKFDDLVKLDREGGSMKTRNFKAFTGAIRDFQFDEFGIVAFMRCPKTQAYRFETVNFTPVCDCCKLIVKTLKRCSGCLAITYCSNKCQKKDWSFHKKHCSQMAVVMATMRGRDDQH